jgi:hypothetical protein
LVVAGQLLNLFTHDYRDYYRAHLDDVPTLAEKRLLQSPVLSADALDLPLFQVRHSPPLHSSPNRQHSKRG